MKTPIGLLFFTTTLLPSCDGKNYRSEKISYSVPQEIVLPLEEVLNNIKFHDTQFSFEFKSDNLRFKFPSQEVIYGGRDMTLGYVLDNIAADYKIRFSVVDDLIIVE